MKPRDLRYKPPLVYELPQALRYPLRGRGKVLLGVGSVVFWALSLLTHVSFVTYIPVFFGVCYLCTYLVRVIAASAASESDPPDWPEFTNWWDDLLRPLLLVLASIGISFLPALIWGLAS